MCAREGLGRAMANLACQALGRAVSSRGPAAVLAEQRRPLFAAGPGNGVPAQAAGQAAPSH